MSKPQGCTNFKLRRLSRTVARGYDAGMRELGLTGPQYTLLSHLLKLGPLAPGALAAALGLDASTLTRNLQALLQAGWVVQEPGPDGRTRRVSITPAGQALRAQAQRRWRASQEDLNRVLGSDRVIALHALLDECHALLDEAGAQPATAPVRAQATT